jgi:DnaJ-class molecular chaperone
MPQSDRHIAEADRCSTCAGVGWKWFPADSETGQEGRWVVCRECIGTGRTDHKGRKRVMPDGAPA